MPKSEVAQQKIQSVGKRKGSRCPQSTGKAGEKILPNKFLQDPTASPHQPDVLQFRIHS